MSEQETAKSARKVRTSRRVSTFYCSNGFGHPGQGGLAGSDISVSPDSDISVADRKSIRTLWLKIAKVFGHLGQLSAAAFGHLGQFRPLFALWDGEYCSRLMMIISFYHHYFFSIR
ncbi:hypothetical protein [Deinococcus hohokamensis]|uniref:Uncharacterized protein n=1 Tax=Deinococcus hohokamensis TaxID=309883 RepID=A0ABV9IFK7_9DEIO